MAQGAKHGRQNARRGGIGRSGFSDSPKPEDQYLQAGEYTKSVVVEFVRAAMPEYLTQVMEVYTVAAQRYEEYKTKYPELSVPERREKALTDVQTGIFTSTKLKCESVVSKVTQKYSGERWQVLVCAAMKHGCLRSKGCEKGNRGIQLIEETIRELYPFLWHENPKAAVDFTNTMSTDWLTQFIAPPEEFKKWLAVSGGVNEKTPYTVTEVEVVGLLGFSVTLNAKEVFVLEKQAKAQLRVFPGLACKWERDVQVVSVFVRDCSFRIVVEILLEKSGYALEAGFEGSFGKENEMEGSALFKLPVPKNVGGTLAAALKGVQEHQAQAIAKDFDPIVAYVTDPENREKEILAIFQRVVVSLLKNLGLNAYLAQLGWLKESGNEDEDPWNLEQEEAGPKLIEQSSKLTLSVGWSTERGFRFLLGSEEVRELALDVGFGDGKVSYTNGPACDWGWKK